MVVSTVFVGVCVGKSSATVSACVGASVVFVGVCVGRSVARVCAYVCASVVFVGVCVGRSVARVYACVWVSRGACSNRRYTVPRQPTAFISAGG